MKFRNISRRLAPAVLAAVLAASPIATLRADDVSTAPVKTYRDDHLTLKLQNDRGVYHGTIFLANKTFSITAHGNATHLDGTFSDTDGNGYAFTADITGDSLIFQTGSSTYRLAADATAAASPASSPAAHNAGVGLQLNFANDGTVTINGLLPGGPAERGGMTVGDQLVAIDGKPLHTVDDLANLMPGSVGSTVTLTVRHEGQNKDFTLTREVITPPPGQTLVGQQPAQPAPADVPLANNNAVDAQLPWLHEGLLISSTWAQWIYPGHTMEFSETIDGKPNAHTPDGRPLMATEIHGTSAGGVAQTVVTAIDGDTACICTNSFADDTVQGFKEPVSQHMPVMQTMKVNKCDMWIEPAKLAEMRSDPDNQILVTSVQWPVGDHKVDAVRITNTSDGYVDQTYDRQTGLCIHMFVVHQGEAPTMKYHLDGETPAGDTVITSADFISMRDLHAPWASEPLPQWTHQFKALHYRGTIAFQGMPNVGAPQQIFMDITSRASGANWVAATVALAQPVPGITTVPQQANVFYGHDQYGGIFAGPAALAKMHEGDVLDTDPVTHMQTVVGKADGRVVSIVSKNSGGGSFNTYDLQTGKMLEYGWLDGISKQAWTYKLVGEE